MEKRQNTAKILIGGSGGQGVLTLGKVTAHAGMNAGLEVSCLPSYTAEMRGGYVYCSVVLSKNRGPFSPVISRADIGVFMNEKAYAMLASSVVPQGVLILNSSFVAPPSGRGVALALPASALAEELGSPRAANMFLAGMLGWALARCGLPISQEHLAGGIAQVFSGEAEQEVSCRAAALGWEKAQEQWKE